jgi:UMF1 family MFS transporter
MEAGVKSNTIQEDLLLKTAVPDKKLEMAWSFYDWANSVFSLVITTAIFPIYYEAVTEQISISQGKVDGVIGAENTNYYVSFLGLDFINTTLYSFALSLAFLVVGFISPMLSGIADVSGHKKRMMQFFCYMGSLSCALLYFFDTGTLYLGVILLITGLIGYAGSIVFYNSFLPEITTEDRYDKVSAKGFSMGYIGSVLLLIICLVVVLFPGLLFPVDARAQQLLDLNVVSNMKDAMEQAKDHYVKLSTKISFVLVGLWWAGFAQITFSRLPKEKKQIRSGENIFTGGFRQLGKVWDELTHLPELKRYLLGFFLCSMGLQTVMYMASLFGSKVLKMPKESLIITVLLIQLIAIAGAYLFSRISRRYGNIVSLIVAIIIWIGICFIAYFIRTENQFYALACLVGMVMGGLQSMFRSTYAKLIPDNTPNHASYFSFYDVSEKFAIVIGTFAYGIIEQLTGSMRLSALLLSAFFISGLLFISRIKNFKVHH